MYQVMVEASSNGTFTPARWPLIINGGQRVEKTAEQLSNPQATFACGCHGEDAKGEPCRCKAEHTADKMKAAVAPDGTIVVVCNEHGPAVHQQFNVPTNRTLRDVLDSMVIPRLNTSDDFHRSRWERRQQVTGLSNIFAEAAS